MKRFSPWWLICVVLPLNEGTAATTHIVGVQVQNQENYSTLLIDLDGPAEVNLFTLASPNRVVLDLPCVKIQKLKQLKSLKGETLREVRMASHPDGKSRIVLDVTRPLSPRTYFVGDEKKPRLVVELRESMGGLKTAPVLLRSASSSRGNMSAPEKEPLPLKTETKSAPRTIPTFEEPETEFVKNSTPKTEAMVANSVLPKAPEVKAPEASKVQSATPPSAPVATANPQVSSVSTPAPTLPTPVPKAVETPVVKTDPTHPAVSEAKTPELAKAQVVLTPVAVVLPAPSVPSAIKAAETQTAPAKAAPAPQPALPTLEATKSPDTTRPVSTPIVVGTNSALSLPLPVVSAASPTIPVTSQKTPETPEVALPTLPILLIDSQALSAVEDHARYSGIATETVNPINSSRRLWRSKQPVAKTPLPVSTKARGIDVGMVSTRPIPPGRDVMVAVDPGHGGKDPGAIGPKGSKEKDITLAIAKRLLEVLRKERGMRSVLTRNGDYFVPLRERIQKARSLKADLLLSIHADASSNPARAGASLYVLSERGASSEAARWLAEQENSADLVAGIHLEKKNNDLARTLLDMSQSATRDASLLAANHLLASLEQVESLSKNTVEGAGFLVLKSPDVPSVLIETTYLSNPEEEGRLTDFNYQQSIAQAIGKGVRAYFMHNPPSGTLIAQIRATEKSDVSIAKR
ncbi:N-acetylmuramoyl-L-alanine amidase [Gammaproteobacteria bacterium]